ncbi:hypothetical protein [Paraconexibacter sp.]|uniref:hypothetical protein n=1 Tax=Paraconexibacter sp. TaxID=2949640 RepID=UPI003566EDFC
MHLHRLRLGEITAAIGAVVLITSLFLDWVELTVGAVPSGSAADGVVRVSESGFSSAGWLLVALLVIVAALAIALVVLTVTLEPVGLTMSVTVATAFFGIIAAVVTALRVALFQPDGGLGDSFASMQLGAYLTLLGVVLCAAGGWITMRDERMDAPYSAAPELEPRPAPPVA